ncbi:MAG: hypothetical protein GY795_03180 [Desulfobacterales bacterium]|nr:hypothetical protein [Desulfobacterales bacterium]
MRKISNFIIFGFFLFMVTTVSAYAAVVKISPETVDLTKVGDTFEVNVEVEDVTDLKGFEFDLTYKPSVVRATKLIPGDFLKNSCLLGPSVGYKKTSFAAFSFDAKGSSGKGLLATILFTKKSEACGKLIFENVSLFDSDSSSPLPTDLHDGELTIYHIAAIPGANGEIEPNGEVPVYCGAGRTFKINPSPCYHVLDVKTDGVSKGPITEYSFDDVEENHTIEASFEKNVHTIEVSAGPGGSIEPPENATVECGTDYKITIIPNDWYSILDVKVDGVSQGPVTEYTFDNITANHKIEAFFEKSKCTIEAVAGEGGKIEPPSSTTVECGASLKYTITPDSCHHILDVKVDGVSQGAVSEYPFTDIRGNHKIEAFFEKDIYTMKAFASAGGNITPSGSTTVECGASLKYTISPDSCYHILDVKIDGVSKGAITEYTFADVRANHKIEVFFEKNKYPNETVVGEGGSISPSGSTTVECGASQRYTITPDPCYHIVDVKIDGVSQGSVTEYTSDTVTASHKIEAFFEKNKYNIEAAAGSGGSITPSGSTTVECGANQKYTITPDSYYHILDVKVDGVSQGPVTEYTFDNVTADHKIEASFEKNKYTIEAVAYAGGSITPSGSTTVECKATQKYTIAPDSCYHILDVKVDGVSQGTVTEYIFTNITADHKIEAFFEKDKYTVSFSSGSGGSISGNTEQTVECGSDTEPVTAIPEDGYYFNGWTGDKISAENPLKIYNATKDMAITALFAKNLCTVTFVAGSDGNVSGNTVQAVECGSGCTETVNPVPDPCYEFAGWTGDTASTENSLKLCNVEKDMTVKADFAKKTHTVSFINGQGGTISGNTVQAVECGGCAEEITAIADSCYEFIGWTGDITAPDNPLKVCDVTNGMTITANFTLKEYEVRLTGVGNGCLEGETLQKVKCGDYTTPVTAVAEPNYNFSAWSGDYDKTDNPLTYGPVTENTLITANFESENLPVLTISPQTICLTNSIKTFYVYVKAENVYDISFFQFDINYDPALVRIEDDSDIEPGPLLVRPDKDLNRFTIERDDTAGKLTFASHLTDNNGLYPDASILAVIRFTVKNQGNGVLKLNNVQFKNRCGYDLVTGEIINAEISVAEPPTVTTNKAQNIESASAYIGGNIESAICSGVTERGVCWSASENPSLHKRGAWKITNDGTGTGNFTNLVQGLNPGTKYYVRAYALSSLGTEYGNQENFTTLPGKPIVEISPISNKSLVSAEGGGEVVSDNGSSITVRGLCWSKSENPTVNSPGSFYSGWGITKDGTGTGEFTSFLTGLRYDTTYYVKAYATNSAGTGYSDQITFKTPSSAYPKVITVSVSNVTSTTASVSGNVPYDCGLPVIAKGVCRSPSGVPMLEKNDPCSQNSAGTGEFTDIIQDLTPGTRYSVRAYATNKLETGYGEESANKLVTAYGEELFFTTPMPLTVTTGPATDITPISAKISGDIVSDGGYPVTEKGICRSTLENPTVECNTRDSECRKTADSGDTGNFTGLLTELVPGTKYYARAYAANSQGILYGNNIPFETLPVIAGDVNGDMSVDMQDVLLALQVLSGIGADNIPIYFYADANGDGKIGTEEVIYILRNMSEQDN